ncbi:hypothetical protein GH714_002576 [Hevea brasiliensis]|uniref:RRM domain-containing protein n=1 Tax=Hevea brasiliensis TaxID=3981 RepID=A0A6A6LMS3_HEVBR|nr:hypothetical protein GH714_002576 [Hevea brasiliensis]
MIPKHQPVDRQLQWEAPQEGVIKINFDAALDMKANQDLGYWVSDSSLQKEFSSFGEIAEVKLVKDEITKRPKAYAFIQYTCQDDAILALENMDQRLIYVELAKPGKGSFEGYPKASGPPKQHLQEKDESADCGVCLKPEQP